MEYEKRIVKNWSVLGKGIENSLSDGTYLPYHTYITKKFTGTEEEFYQFCDSLYDTIECWNEIESGLADNQEIICIYPKTTKEYDGWLYLEKYKQRRLSKSPFIR